MHKRSGLTRFMCAILAPDMTTERLKAMNIEKTAAHYKLPEQTVREYRDWQAGMRRG